MLHCTENGESELGTLIRLCAAGPYCGSEKEQPSGDMDHLTDLNKVAQAMVASGKGILAADKSSGTIKKRFDAIKVEVNRELPPRLS